MAAETRSLAGAGAGLAGARTIWPALVVFAMLAAFPFVASFMGWSGHTYTIAARVMIFAIAAVSLDLILGYGAMVSFGHAAFIGIGAYAVAIPASHGVSESLFMMVLAVLVAALYAALTGAVSLKTRGVHFIMITLAFGQMAYFTMTSLSAYGGDDGLTIWRRPTFAGLDLLGDRMVFHYLALGLLVGVYFVCRAVVRSRFGRVLRGCREGEERMRALGYNPYLYRLAAYTLAGALAGISGALLALQVEFASPAYMSWHRSGELIVMVVLGGMGTLHGAIIGAGAFILTEEALSRITQHWRMVFGPLLILVVLFLRGGLGGLFRTRPDD